MLSKDLRRAERRWRSHCVWMRRLKNDWATHGWNWNYLSAKPYGGGFSPDWAYPGSFLFLLGADDPVRLFLESRSEWHGKVQRHAPS